MVRHTIILDGNIESDVILREENMIAGESVTPGQLVEIAGNTVLRHNGAGTNSRRMFALENPATEHAIGSQQLTIDHPYVTGEMVRCGTFRRGSAVYAWLAAGQNVAKEAALESDGDGALAAWAVDAAQPENLVGYAREAVNNAAGTVPVRIAVEVA